MALRWEEGHLPAGCPRDEGENGAAVMLDWKESVIHLPESWSLQSQVDVFRHQELTRRNGDAIEGRAERVHRKDQSWVCTKVWQSPQ